MIEYRMCNQRTSKKHPRLWLYDFFKQRYKKKKEEKRSFSNEWTLFSKGEHFTFCVHLTPFLLCDSRLHTWKCTQTSILWYLVCLLICLFIDLFVNRRTGHIQISTLAIFERFFLYYRARGWLLDSNTIVISWSTKDLWKKIFGLEPAEQLLIDLLHRLAALISSIQ